MTHTPRMATQPPRHRRTTLAESSAALNRAVQEFGTSMAVLTGTRRRALEPAQVADPWVEPHSAARHNHTPGAVCPRCTPSGYPPFATHRGEYR